MPTIASFSGVTIYMYWDDHAPPHVHAFSGGFEAMIAIENGAIIGGRLPRRNAALVKGWVLRHHEALIDIWRRGEARMPFRRVPGADNE